MSIHEGKGEEEGDGEGWKHIDFGDVELGEIIGGGGVGVIYMGWYKDKTVALKTLFDPRVDESLKQEYLDELLVMSKIKHSNVVTFMGACLTSPHLFFMMELCENSLYTLLHVDRIQFTEKENMRIAVDIGSAMEYLHSLKPAVVHRDLKSLNILKSYDGYYKVCDFGLVKNKNTQAGTPAYMAPELFRNKPYNKSVDVYAFAVTMWELFAQEVPYKGYDPISIRDKVLANQRPSLPLPMASSRMSRLVGDCWSDRGDDRPDFTAVVDALLEISDSVSESKHTESLGHAMDSLEGLMRK